MHHAPFARRNTFLFGASLSAYQRTGFQIPKSEMLVE